MSHLSRHSDHDAAIHGPVALVGLQVGGEAEGGVEEDCEEESSAQEIHLGTNNTLHSHIFCKQIRDHYMVSDEESIFL